MIDYDQMFSNIEKVGISLPKKSYSNDELIREFAIDSSNDWIIQMTGIEKRYFVESQEEFESMCIEAVEKLEIENGKIEGIIVSSSTNYYNFPGISQIVHSHFNLDSHVRALDINSACNGFMSGLSIANMWMQVENLDNIVIIAADAMSSILNMEDRATNCLFGDAAGAVLIKKSKEKGIKAWDHIIESKEYKSLTANKHIKMDGRLVFENAIRVFTRLIENLLKKTNLKIEDIDLIIPHQANKRIFEKLAKNLGIENSKIPFLASQTGNTSAATIPLALYNIFDTLKNSNYILAGFGAGFSASACIIQNK
jgi:3-oxoacyl-[acyl-carrier-protein] synthase-3